MRRKQVWRYWCDHCNKGGCGGGAIAKHERRCIKNPARVCGMCAYADIGDEQKPMPELLAAFDAGGGLEALTEAAQHCPACILATIVQARIRDKAAGTFNEDSGYVEFDYKAASTVYLSEANAAKERSEYYG